MQSNYLPMPIVSYKSTRSLRRSLMYMYRLNKIQPQRNQTIWDLCASVMARRAVP